MPKSRQGKKSRAIRQSVKPPLTSIDNVIHIRSKTFARLQSNADFINLIRVGRALSTIGASFELAAIAAEHQKRNFLGVRATFILGGYVHETLLLAESLRKDYEGKHFFEPFLTLLENDWPRRLIKNIRNHAAFHLDWQGKTTAATLLQFEKVLYPFISFPDTNLKGPYFDLADAIDIKFSTAGLSEGLTEEEALLELAKIIRELAEELAEGANALILGLAAKLGLLPPTELLRRTNRGEILSFTDRWLSN